MRYLQVCLVVLFLTVGLCSAQRRMGTIYDPNSGPPVALADKTAARVGDLITVVIQETQNLRNEERTGQSKTTNLNYQLIDFAVKPDAFSSLPTMHTARQDQFAGQANIEKRGTFTARLTAMVIDTLPNGNLVIQGRRELRIDGEVKLLEFSGVVRRYDVTRTNTVQSELVADARVSYVGEGPARKALERRGLAKWLHSAVDWLWPF